MNQAPTFSGRAGGSCKIFLGLDVLDAGGRVDVELTTALAKEELDGGKVALVDGEATGEFGSGDDEQPGTIKFVP